MEAAEVICAAADIDGVDVVDVMDQLVTKPLVMADEAEAAVRYRLLETIRGYAPSTCVGVGPAG